MGTWQRASTRDRAKHSDFVRAQSQLPRLWIIALAISGLLACSESGGKRSAGDVLDASDQDAMADGDSGVEDGDDIHDGDDPDDSDGGPPVCASGMDAGCIPRPAPACGDGLLNVAGETCDDGNGESGDGCTATCTLEANFVCPEPGAPCVSTVVCGDGKITGEETCDDGNTKSLDGCSETCGVEAGWKCPMAGARCEADQCGDGIVAGFEECDFTQATPGCTDCMIDAQYDCTAAGCSQTVCGNGTVERGEQCEDGNELPFDGCFACKKEPHCSGGVCEPVCGDGQRYKNEECDDGNLRDGDGCSSTCTVEYGYECVDEAEDPPDEVKLPILFRDFIGQGRSKLPTSSCYDPVFDEPSSTKPIPCFHINFNGLTSNVPGGAVEKLLGENGRPVYVCGDRDVAPPAVPECADNPGQTGKTNSNVGANNNRDNFTGFRDFDQWYDSSYQGAFPVVGELALTRQTSGPLQGSYVFDGSKNFYPLDGEGWVKDGKEETACGHNVSFTSETHFWFEYQGGERFVFDGDDDMWVFVNGHRVVDLGGLHGSLKGTFELDADTDGDGPDIADGTVTTPAPGMTDDNKSPLTTPAERDLGMTVGGIYEIVMFHAERNECGSNFSVTLKNFNRPKSRCFSTCGDNKVASNEVCDQGEDNASESPAPYGQCASDCKSRGGYCGDGHHDSDQGELCDDGVNRTVYGVSGCAPECKLPAFCGDGQVQSKFEACDDGVNDGGYGECAPGCVLGPHCGDGVRDFGEECDDGNRQNNDGCNVNCVLERIL